MQSSKTSHGLAVLIPAGREGGAGGGEGEVFIAIAREGMTTSVRASQMVGGRERVRAGGVEMGLDCLRRVLSGQKIDDKVDFELQ